MKTITARFDSTCPGCETAISAGDRVAKPEGIKNKKGGDEFLGCWYCLPCAEDYQALGDLGHFRGGNFLDLAAIEAHNARSRPFLLRIAERAARNEDAAR